MSVRDKRLYLEDLTVSFDGFKALNELYAVRRSGGAALHHRPQRRRQDHHDGRHHGEDAPGFGNGVVRRRHRSARAVRAGNRGSRNRAEVSEADRVRAADRVREPRTGAGRHPVVPENAARPHYARATRENRRGPGHHRPLGAARGAGKNTRRTARSSGSKSACC